MVGPIALAQWLCLPGVRDCCVAMAALVGCLVCSSCRHQGTVTAGTLLDKTRTPLTTWFEASRGLVFRRLLEQAVVTGPVTQAEVTHGYDW